MKVTRRRVSPDNSVANRVPRYATVAAAVVVCDMPIYVTAGELSAAGVMVRPCHVTRVMTTKRQSKIAPAFM